MYQDQVAVRIALAGKHVFAIIRVMVNITSMGEAILMSVKKRRRMGSAQRQHEDNQENGESPLHM